MAERKPSLQDKLLLVIPQNVNVQTVDADLSLANAYVEKGEVSKVYQIIKACGVDMGLHLGLLRDACRNARDIFWHQGKVEDAELMNARMDALDYLIEAHRYDYRGNRKD